MSEQWTTVYSNAPSYRRSCDECGEQYRPEGSWHRRCNKCRVGARAVKEVDELIYEMEDGKESCLCEPCHFDLRTTEYQVTKEDPAYDGTRCKWHDQIKGRSATHRIGKYRETGYAVIYISSSTPKETILTCDIADLISPSNTKPEEHSLFKALGGYSKDFSPEELPHYATLIGAKLR